jgi:hypothetical protein
MRRVEGEKDAEDAKIMACVQKLFRMMAGATIQQETSVKMFCIFPIHPWSNIGIFSCESNRNRSTHLGIDHSS